MSTLPSAMILLTESVIINFQDYMFTKKVQFVGKFSRRKEIPQMKLINHQTQPDYEFVLKCMLVL